MGALRVPFFDYQTSIHGSMAWTAKDVAVEDEGPRPVGYKLYCLKLSRQNGPSVDTEFREQKTVGYVLAGQTKAHNLADLGSDDARLPALLGWHLGRQENGFFFATVSRAQITHTPDRTRHDNGDQRHRYQFSLQLHPPDLPL
jgi:hypothetical protein